MLKKSKRLTRAVFDQVYRNGKNFSFTYFTLKFFHTGADSPVRASVVVSKKLLKSAVDRNNARRRVYGALEGKLIGHGFDMIIFPKKEFLKLDKKTIQNELDKNLPKG